MSKKIKVIVCEPGKSPEINHIDDSLESMQSVVGGYIECVALKDNIDIWINEEGLLLDLPYNRTVNGVPLVGTIFAAGRNSDGDTLSLSDKQISKALEYFSTGD